MGKIIAVISAKGGSGQTLISVNLAAALSSKSKLQCALADFTGSPDIDTLLNIRDPKPLSGLLDTVNHLDTQLLKGYLSSHHSGIQYLKGSIPDKHINDIAPAHLESVIGLMSRTYPYTVIDTGRDLSEQSLTVLDKANLVLLVMTPNLLSFNRTKHMLETLTSMHYPLSLIKLVLNMHGTHNALPDDKIASYLKNMILARIAYDTPTVLSSVNKGVIPVLQNQRSDFSRSLSAMADILLSDNGMYTERDPVIQRTLKNPCTIETPSPVTTRDIPAEDTHKDGIILKNSLHKKLLDEIDLKTIRIEGQTEETKSKVRNALEKLLAREEASWLTDRDRRTVFINEMLDEVLGLGPLEQFLRDPSITEIMSIGTDMIYIEQGGRIRLTGAAFTSETQLMAIIERIVAPLGRRVDESSPLCDARLPNGSRVNIIIPPLALDGPAITIRKFSEKKLSIHDLVQFNALSDSMADFLKLCVMLKKNIIVSGGTGSGKTTLLNILSSFIPEHDRIVTIEDSAELKLQQTHVVRLEGRPSNIEGRGAVTIRQLVINALRMRPDRIIVGECRGGEALDMLQAMNTGHDGSLTTVHANSPRDTLSRLETMVLMANTELPVKAVREQVKSSIDIIIHQARFPDGSRKITSITEITGIEGDIITSQDIFRFNQSGISREGSVLGEFTPTGIVPGFIHEVKTQGIEFNMGIFK